MKKIALLLSLVMLTSVFAAACGTSTKPDSTTAEGTTTAADGTDATAAPAARGVRERIQRPPWHAARVGRPRQGER